MDELRIVGLGIEADAGSGASPSPRTTAATGSTFLLLPQ
jgi:hypothetical protein